MHQKEGYGNDVRRWGIPIALHADGTNVLAVGMEKLFHKDKQRTFDVFTGAADTEDMESVIEGIKAVFGDRITLG